MPPGQVPRGMNYAHLVGQMMDMASGGSAARRMHKRLAPSARSPQQQPEQAAKPSMTSPPPSDNQANTSPGNGNTGNDKDSGNNQPQPSTHHSSPSPSAFGCPLCIARDNDLRVMYNGSWTLNGTPSSTSHSTTSPGATVSFAFNGTGIVVFGTVPASNDTVRPPTAAYTIDSAPAHVSQLPMAPRAITDQPLFGALQLAGDIEHLISISIQTADAPFTLEYFFVFPRPANSSQDVVNTNLPLAPTAYTTQLPAPSAVLMNQDGSGNTVKILAALLGSLVVIMIVGFVLFFFRRRRQCGPLRDSTAGNSSMTIDRDSGLPPCPSPPEKSRDTLLTSTESIMRNTSTWSAALSSRSTDPFIPSRSMATNMPVPPSLALNFPAQVSSLSNPIV